MVASALGQGGLVNNRQKHTMMRVAKYDATKGKNVYKVVSGRVVREIEQGKDVCCSPMIFNRGST